MNLICLFLLLALTWRSNAKPFRSCKYAQSVCGSSKLDLADRAVLLSFKSSFSGLGSDWNPSLTCAQGWTGVCTDSTGRVTELYLSGISLHVIPLNLTTLSALVYLDVSGNFLNETALPTIAKMKQLKYLDLSNSVFYSFPRSSLDSLTSLVFLSLSKNQYMTGETIPSLNTLKSLEHLDLSYCNFGGAIPSSFATFTGLKTLYLNKNRLCGGIPSYLENLPLLTKLDLTDNFLTGSVPSKLQSKFCSAFPQNCLTTSKVCSFQGKSSLSCGNGCNPVPGLVQDLTQKWGCILIPSSTYWYGGASLAIDGSAGFGNFFRRTCAHTLNQTNPFLLLDVHLVPVVITTVQLYNRLDCCSDRLNGVQVYVGSSWDAYNAPGNKQCVDPKFTFGPNTKGFPLNVTCNLPGSAVWVVVPGKKKILTICEVVIYGTYGSFS